jgi:flagellar hook-basal body complex protein FliE
MNSAALLAAKAYGAAPAAGILTNGPAVANTDFNFSSMLAQQVSATVDATKAAEMQGARAATGRSEMIDVVTAVAAAEVQMETMLAFRDQAIQAYQEIMRMPI